MDLSPSASSLVFRSSLASLIAPLRRVRPRVPFYKLAAHRIPTLWTLYRGLLRESQGENARFRIRTLFRRYQHLTSPATTRAKLLQGYKWLELFQRANAGDTTARAISCRYDRMIGAKREKEHWKHLIMNEFEWQEKLLNRPILTGGYLRPTLYNRPLPRLKPQPLPLSMMIYKRRVARERRMVQAALLRDWRDDLKRERDFEFALMKRQGAVYGSLDDWDQPVRSVLSTLLRTFALDDSRSLSPYPPELLAAIKQARRDKIANKTWERERERRGEILRCTLRRRRKGPPAHVLARMTREQRRLDRIGRGVGFAGYVGAVKRRMGFKDKRGTSSSDD